MMKNVFFLSFCVQNYVFLLKIKDVNTVPEAVPVWPPVRYISDTGQYRCTVSGLPLYYIYIYIYIYMYVCMYVSVYIYIIINIKVYNKTFSQFRTNYSWFYTLVSIKWEKK